MLSKYHCARHNISLTVNKDSGIRGLCFMDLSSAVRSAVKAAPAGDRARAAFLRSCAGAAPQTEEETQLAPAASRASFLKSLGNQRGSGAGGQTKRKISFGFKDLKKAVALSNSSGI